MTTEWTCCRHPTCQERLDGLIAENKRLRRLLAVAAMIGEAASAVHAASRDPNKPVIFPRAAISEEHDA